MKMKLPLKLVALAIAVTPYVASAIPDIGSDTEIDADLTINLRLTGEGELIERNGRESRRFVTSRMGNREILAILEQYPRFLTLSEGEGAEGGPAQQSFPRGSRLVKTEDNGVWVVDRQGNQIFDARPYISVGTNTKNQIVAYNFDSNNGNLQSTSLTQLYLEISLDGFMVMNEESSEGEGGNYTEVQGPATKRYSERFSRTRVTETLNVTSRVSGGGYQPLLGDYNAEGVVNLRGRSSEDNLPR